MTATLDDIAVDRFSAAMKAKLAKKREEGRRGWDDPEQCSRYDLSCLLIEHVLKGDPVDVANFAMMLHQRSERIALEPSACEKARDSAPCQLETLLRTIELRASRRNTPAQEAPHGRE